MSISRRTCLAMGLAMGLSACLGSASPFGVVKDFYAAVQAGNTDKALQYMALAQVSADEMRMVKPKVEMMVAQSNSVTEANGGMGSIELLEEKIAEDGQTARIHVKLTYKNGKTKEENFKLRQEDGNWKIIL